MDRLDITAVDPPEMKPPVRKNYPEPLAVKFARQVLAEQITGWVRLNHPVSRSIVSTKAKQFAATYGVEFKVSLDFEIPGDPKSPRHPHLFCRIVPIVDVPLREVQ